jgi:hypothetical protein
MSPVPSAFLGHAVALPRDAPSKSVCPTITMAAEKPKGLFGKLREAVLRPLVTVPGRFVSQIVETDWCIFLVLLYLRVSLYRYPISNRLLFRTLSIPHVAAAVRANCWIAHFVKRQAGGTAKAAVDRARTRWVNA